MITVVRFVRAILYAVKTFGEGSNNKDIDIINLVRFVRYVRAIM